MFLKPKKRLSGWLASPDFLRMLDAVPDALALCDRDLKPLATSAALRRLAGPSSAAAWIDDLAARLAASAVGDGPLPGASARYPLDPSGGNAGEAVVAAIPAADGGLAGYWIRFDRPAMPAKTSGTPKTLFDPAQSYAEFDRNGTILTASRSFQALFHPAEGRSEGRSLGQFLADPRDADEVLGRIAQGMDASGDYAVATETGKDVWAGLHFFRYAECDARGAAGAVLARDITSERLTSANDAATLAALSRSQAVIEFRPDGTILSANTNFLKAMEYSDLSDIVGRHHRIFVFREDQETAEYAAFWRRLAWGEFFTGKFRRTTRSGREIWIEASYNPVFEADGKVSKIVKFASDITKQMNVSRKVTASLGMVEAVALGSVQMASSIREISGTVQTSREAVTKISHSIDQSLHLAEGMASSAQSMERVIGLIKDIADTVNLLALNATIEAARAGSAGKSFAVVASEVKNLAAQTNDAIGDIEKEIKAMQTVAHDVRHNVEGISLSVSKVTESVGMVASAIAEQTAATSEISRNIALISTAVSELSDLVAT